MLISQRQFMLMLLATVLCYLAVYYYQHSKMNLHFQHAVHSLDVTLQKSPEQLHLHTHNVVNVQSGGNFTERVSHFNAFLSSFRAEELNNGRTRIWQAPTSRSVHVVTNAKRDYFISLSNYSKVTTVILPWLTNSSVSTLQNSSNVLIQNYFEWTADDKHCSWLEKRGEIRKHIPNRDIYITVRPRSLHLSYANAKYVFYMHIHRDAIITAHGNVITDRLKLILHGCRPHDKTIPSRYDHAPLYTEVLVLRQGIWGRGTFHHMVEIMPRIALLVDFLKANPEICIMAPQVGGRLAHLLRIIGLDKPKVITGVTRAKIVYQPRATPCGVANVQESQMLSQLFRNYIKEKFPEQPRNRLILIRRSKTRRFLKHNAIDAVLRRVAMNYNLTYTLFIDNPTPSLSETMKIFHSAVIIVGAHGAGLSNMLFSQPGTYVIEGGCNLPHVLLCYRRLAYVLGHHWHGITAQGRSSRVPCRIHPSVNISPLHIDAVVREYLRM